MPVPLADIPQVKVAWWRMCLWCKRRVVNQMHHAKDSPPCCKIHHVHAGIYSRLTLIFSPLMLAIKWHASWRLELLPYWYRSDRNSAIPTWSYRNPLQVAPQSIPYTHTRTQQHNASQQQSIINERSAHADRMCHPSTGPENNGCFLPGCSYNQPSSIICCCIFLE